VERNQPALGPEARRHRVGPGGQLGVGDDLTGRVDQGRGRSVALEVDGEPHAVVCGVVVGGTERPLERHHRRDPPWAGAAGPPGNHW
jgi:hypothetical protein